MKIIGKMLKWISDGFDQDEIDPYGYDDKPASEIETIMEHCRNQMIIIGRKMLRK